jgi:hypothetical protein
MKNLVKPLEWKRVAKNDTHEAPIYDFGCYFFIVKHDDKMYCTAIDNYNNGLWIGRTCDTLEEAKAACQEYYAKMILAGLSPEAVAALESISSPNQTFNT